MDAPPARQAGLQDTTAPSLQCPADIETQVAEGGKSLPYTFAATATDAVTAEPTLTYSHESGSLFNLGDTLVKVTATGAAGNAGTCSFKVKVTELESGCGCGATPGTGGWMWLAGLGWWLWRGRRLPEPKGPGNTS
nr:HYR domain-containing protein [Corallococcus exiguus]